MLRDERSFNVGDLVIFYAAVDRDRKYPNLGMVIKVHKGSKKSEPDWYYEVEWMDSNLPSTETETNMRVYRNHLHKFMRS